MAVLQTNQNLVSTYREARHFLNLDQSARADSDWFKSFLNHPDVRSFFRKSVFAKGTILQVAAVTQVAAAYVSCVDNDTFDLPPTSAEVRGLIKSADDLESKLDAARPSWLQTDIPKSFRGPLKSLREAASTVVPRSAGRPPLTQRRTFVLQLAQALYEMADQIPIRFIATAAARVWEDTTDRQVREILTDEQRSSIKRQTETKRRQVADSENTAHLLLNRASIPPKTVPAVREPLTDSQIYDEMMKLAKRFSDETSVVLAVDYMHMLRRDIGIEPDIPQD
ncbi:hypothetical protein [Burkholderia pseudomallei]|uniref:hypothetical protein n=1 Tax=Burkholderia pseudomallei TaxID=28450 RepID=UPI0009754D2D|nr:hypothetical protein [Burkholderia pseudomallei]OMR89921.1 hypothetical protein AQ733_17805 [Burkholderia pseudomallei]OMS16425.1 hypothetical protein AQ735_27420 [Burkholderia pseudomallei]